MEFLMYLGTRIVVLFYKLSGFQKHSITILTITSKILGGGRELDIGDGRNSSFPLPLCEILPNCFPLPLCEILPN